MPKTLERYCRCSSAGFGILSWGRLIANSSSVILDIDYGLTFFSCEDIVKVEVFREHFVQADKETSVKAYAICCHVSRKASCETHLTGKLGHRKALSLDKMF